MNICRIFDLKKNLDAASKISVLSGDNLRSLSLILCIINALHSWGWRKSTIGPSTKIYLSVICLIVEAKAVFVNDLVKWKHTQYMIGTEDWATGYMYTNGYNVVSVEW